MSTGKPWRPNPESPLPMLEYVSVLCNPQHHRSNRDLNGLPVDERKKVFEDLAGSNAAPAEDVNQLAAAIQQLEVELSKISKKNAYDLACSIDADYVNDVAFRLMFLRGNDYDPKKSAQQMVNHFEEKLVLFGNDKLARDIKMSDLNDDDMVSLTCGGVQVPNIRDKAGRCIMFFRFIEYKFKTHNNWCRATWYLMMATLQDEEVQKNGLVSVAYEVGDEHPPFDFELLRRELSKMKCIPFKLVGGHFCTSNAKLMAVLDLIIHMSSPFFRVRIRAHYGIETEVLYQLMTFGIPVFSVPWTGGGDNNHARWIEERKRIEARQEGGYMDYDADDMYDMEDISYSSAMDDSLV